MPDTASVAEENGSVQVCATLSDVPAGGTVAVDIMLATSDGEIITPYAYARKVMSGSTYVCEQFSDLHTPCMMCCI